MSMMQTIQLELPFDRVGTVQCPRCGHVFDARRARLATRLAGLSPATRDVWNAGGRSFQHGRESMGPSQLAARVNLAPSTVSYHLALLRQAGLVRAIPQNKYRRQRHVYTGTL